MFRNHSPHPVNILQRVQNDAARLICNLKPCERVTASLKQLLWLPVKQRVQYKLCMVMYSIHFGLAPLYITELVSTVAAQTSRPGNLDCVLLIRQTTFNHGHVRSLENAPFCMLTQQSGT